ncbi:MAG: hypothetical protein WBQ78_13155 [Gammaproteobacteria bacterium]
MKRTYSTARHPPLRTLPGLAVMALVVLPLLASCDAVCKAVCETSQPAGEIGQPRDIGYAVLKKLLDDEQHVKTLRIVKSIITLSKASDPTAELIDDIATVSARGLDDLETLVALRPAINLDTSSQEQLGSDIFNALRVATARELITATGDDFELSLVLSQIQALRLIGQLLKEIQELDPNPKRQAWLAHLASDYETLYSRAVARLSINGARLD